MPTRTKPDKPNHTWCREDLGQRLYELREEQIRTLDASDPVSRARRASIDADATEVQRLLAEKDRRHKIVRSLASDPSRWERIGGGQYELPATQAANVQVRKARNVVERHYANGDLSERAALRLEELTRDDRGGQESRYITAVSSPFYRTGFFRMLTDPMAPHSLTPEEQRAVREVSDASWDRDRSMGVGTGSAGGFALPFTLDPTLLHTSDGSVNPLRNVARIVTVTTHAWKGVTSSAVSAAYQAEGTEVADDSPTLGQPEVDTEMARAFVPFSIELGQDWGAIQNELVSLIREAKDLLEAQKFLTGVGHASNEPQGLLVGAASEHVQTAGSGAFAIADVYAVKEALPPRFWANASWLGSPTIFDKTRRFVGGGSQEVALWDDGPPPTLLRKPIAEYPQMDTTVVAGHQVLVYGDLRQAMVIVDRIGMNVELVPHLFGPNQRPTGQRGVFAFWRNSSLVVNPNGVRVLVVKS